MKYGIEEFLSSKRKFEVDHDTTIRVEHKIEEGVKTVSGSSSHNILCTMSTS